MTVSDKAFQSFREETHRSFADFHSFREEARISFEDFRTFKEETRSSFTAVNADFAKLRSEIGELRSELRSEMVELRSELRSEMGELRSELRSFAVEIRSSVQKTSKRVEAVDDRLAETDQRLTGRIFGQREEFHREQLDLRAGLADVNKYVEEVEKQIVGDDLRARILANIHRLNPDKAQVQRDLSRPLDEILAGLRARGFGGPQQHPIIPIEERIRRLKEIREARTATTSVGGPR